MIKKVIIVYCLFKIICYVFRQELIDSTKVIKVQGYSVEEHNVTTEDGYILNMIRIPKGFSTTSFNLSPIILVHGLTANIGYFIDYSNESLAYVLADSGYDVWLLNCRANGYSNKHVTYDPQLNPEQFYNFSVHEIGYYDLPAAIDYVLNVTEKKSLHYLGHSQGGTAFYIMASSRPEYNKKINLATIFAGTAIMKNVPDSGSRFLANWIDTLESTSSILNLYHLSSLEEFRGFFYRMSLNPILVNFCYPFINFAFGFENNAQIKQERLQHIFRYYPSDASFKQMFHYGQLIKTGRFQQYDYGLEGNLQRYKNETPPKYDFSKITAPLAIYYSHNDRFLSVADSEEVISLLPNVVHKLLIPYEKFNHGDYVLAKDVKELLYVDVLEVMNKYRKC